MEHLDKVLTKIDPEEIETNDVVDLEDTVDLTEVLENTQKLEIDIDE